MVQSNADRLRGHGTIDLWMHGGPGPRWSVYDAEGKKVGDAPLTDDGDAYADALALLGLRRPFQRDRVLLVLNVRETWDDGDPWGSGMRVLGQLVDAQNATSSAVPFDDKETADLVRALEQGRFTYRALRRAIRIMNRYLDLPGVAARSY